MASMQVAGALASAGAPSVACTTPLIVHMPAQPAEPNAILRAEVVAYNTTPGAIHHIWSLSYVDSTTCRVLLNGPGTAAGVMATMLDLQKSSATAAPSFLRDGPQLQLSEVLMKRMMGFESAPCVTISEPAARGDRASAQLTAAPLAAAGSDSSTSPTVNAPQLRHSSAARETDSPAFYAPAPVRVVPRLEFLQQIAAARSSSSIDDRPVSQAMQALPSSAFSLARASTPENGRKRRKHISSQRITQDSAGGSDASLSPGEAFQPDTERRRKRRRRRRVDIQHAGSLDMPTGTSLEQDTPAGLLAFSEARTAAQELWRTVDVRHGDCCLRASIIPKRGSRTGDDGVQLHFWRVMLVEPSRRASLRRCAFVYQGWHERAALVVLMELHARGQRLLPSPTYPDMSVIRAMLADITFDGQRVMVTFKKSEGPHPEFEDMFYWNAQVRVGARQSTLFNGWRTEPGLVAELRALCSGTRASNPLASIAASPASAAAAAAAAVEGSLAPGTANSGASAAAAAAPVLAATAGAAISSTSSELRRQALTCRVVAKVEQHVGDRLFRAEKLGQRGTRDTGESFWRFRSFARGRWRSLCQMWLHDGLASRMLGEHVSATRLLPELPVPDIPAIRRAIESLRFHGGRLLITFKRDCGEHPLCDGAYYWNVRVNGDARDDHAHQQIFNGWQTAHGLVDDLRTICLSGAATIDMPDDAEPAGGQQDDSTAVQPAAI